MEITSKIAGKKEYYTWNQYQKDILILTNKVRKITGRKFNNIYGIPRGGLVVAVSLSHALGIPLILSRDDISPNTLVVDDIVDSGKTLDALTRQLGFRLKVVTLYCHPRSTFAPDAYVREKKHWIVFPWETNLSSQYDGTAL